MLWMQYTVLWRSQATRQPRTKPGTLGNQAQTHSLTSHRAERYSLSSLSPNHSSSSHPINHRSSSRLSSNSSLSTITSPLDSPPPILASRLSLLLSTLLQFSPLDSFLWSQAKIPRWGPASVARSGPFKLHTSFLFLSIL